MAPGFGKTAIWYSAGCGGIARGLRRRRLGTGKCLPYPGSGKQHFLRFAGRPARHFVGGGASVRVPKLIVIARMTDMMLTGRVYSAVEGEQIGLSQYLVGDGQGFDKAYELAQKIAANAGMTNYALMHVLPRIVDAGQGLNL